METLIATVTISFCARTTITMVTSIAMEVRFFFSLSFYKQDNVLLKGSLVTQYHIITFAMGIIPMNVLYYPNNTTQYNQIYCNVVATKEYFYIFNFLVLYKL